MTVLMSLLLAWVALSVLGVLGAIAVCRSGHLEDVARGFDEPLPYPTQGTPTPVPAPRAHPALTHEVTR